MVHYHHVVSHVHELKETKPNVVIVGYDDCPFTRRTEQIVNQNPSCRTKLPEIALITFKRVSGPQMRKQLHHQEGTFPVIFIKNNDDDMEYVGGSTELEQYMQACST